MEIINNLISQLDSATSDPIVKLLVVSVTILIIVIVFTLVINLIKRFFSAISRLFRRKNRNKTQKKQQNKKITKAQQIEPTTVIAEDTHLKDAEAILDELAKSLSKAISIETKQDGTEPLSIKSDRPIFTAESIKQLDLNLDIEKKTTDILSNIEGKTISQLEEIIKSTENSLSAVKKDVEANKNSFLKLTQERKILLTAESDAINSYNDEVEKTKSNVENHKKLKDRAVLDIANTEKEIKDLVEAETNAAKALKEAREQLIRKLAEAQIIIDKTESSLSNAATLSDDTQKSFVAKKVIADKASSALDENDVKLSALMDKVAEGEKDLSFNQLKLKIVLEKTEQLKAEEAARLAAQKEREEAEAKARALEEAKRLEEEKRRREEEERIAEERRKEEERRREEERLALEKARELQIQEEQKRLAEEIQREREEKQRELKKQQENQVAPQQASVEGNSDDQILTAEEEAAQAKAMMEAQRAKRRKSALQKKQGKLPDKEPAPSVSPVQEPKVDIVENETVVEHDVVKEQEEPLNSVSQATQIPPTPPQEDPMEKIKAEWERERNVQEALKAGDVEEALNLVNKKTN